MKCIFLFGCEVALWSQYGQSKVWASWTGELSLFLNTAHAHDTYALHPEERQSRGDTVELRSERGECALCPMLFSGHLW